MKTKLTILVWALLSTFCFSQSKKATDKEKLKFYFPVKNDDYGKKLKDLAAQLYPYEINDKEASSIDDICIAQKDYPCIITYSKTEKFPKHGFFVKNYAEAMMADASKGEKFKKTFTENFRKDFTSADESAKTMVAGRIFDLQMFTEVEKMRSDFMEELSKRETDSISYDDALKLLSFESYSEITNAIYPLGKDIVKGYVPEYSQPYITGSLWMSVVKPKEVNDIPDTSKEYKLLFELIDFNYKNEKETAYKKENFALTEAGRIINLHVASGIPAEKLKMVFVIHGNAVNILLNNEKYKEKYKIDNPNIALIKQLQSKGAKFVVCGQLMTWAGMKLSDLTEDIKEAYSAKTALTNYQNQGYILEKISAED